MRRCVNCQFVRDMPGKFNQEVGLFYCDEDKIKGENYGHPIWLGDKACKHWKAIIKPCDFKIKIVCSGGKCYALDEKNDILAIAGIGIADKNFLTKKAYRHVRDTFLLQKKQLDLFVDVGGD